MGYTIAWFLGLTTGLAMPFMVGFRHKVRASQNSKLDDLPTSPLPAGNDLPPILDSIGFRMAPAHRRVTRRPNRPGPRGAVVR